MDAWNRSQVERRKKRLDVVPSNFTIPPQLLKYSLAIDNFEFLCAIEGSIGAIPRRAMVRDEDAPRARRILAEAGEALPE